MLLLLAHTSRAATAPTITLPTLTIAAVTVRQVGAAKFVSISTTITTVDQWLIGANSLLQTDNSDAHTSDVACPLKLVSTGSMGTFSSVNVVNDQDDIDLLVKEVPELIKLVNRIEYCKGPAPVFATIQGCAGIRNGKPFLILGTDELGGIPDQITAHEYGHTRGLQHHTVVGEERYVMYYKEVTNIVRNVVNGNECQIFQN